MKKDNISAEARATFAKNINRIMKEAGKERADLVKDLGIKYSTIAEWANGRKYPRVDKMQILADYFGVLKSDLTEEKNTRPQLSERVLRLMGENEDFGEIVELLSKFDADTLKSIKQIAKSIAAK